MNLLRAFLGRIVPTVAWAAATLAVASPASARTNDGSFGLGLILGEPTGVSAKLWLGGRNAFTAAAAWSFANETAFHVHGDYLWHFFDRVRIEEGQLPLYVGVGGRIKDRNEDADVGVRFPLGATYLFEDAPLDVFLEVVPILEVAPDSDLRLNAATGVRYYFN